MTRLTRVTARLFCATSIVVASCELNCGGEHVAVGGGDSVACASSSRVRRLSTAPGGAVRQLRGRDEPWPWRPRPAPSARPARRRTGPRRRWRRSRSCPAPGTGGRARRPAAGRGSTGWRGLPSSWMPTTTTALSSYVVEFGTGSIVPTVQPYLSAATFGDDDLDPALGVGRRRGPGAGHQRRRAPAPRGSRPGRPCGGTVLGPPRSRYIGDVSHSVRVDGTSPSSSSRNASPAAIAASGPSRSRVRIHVDVRGRDRRPGQRGVERAVLAGEQQQGEGAQQRRADEGDGDDGRQERPLGGGAVAQHAQAPAHPTSSSPGRSEGGTSLRGPAIVKEPRRGCGSDPAVVIEPIRTSSTACTLREGIFQPE